jgi:hypothetical protein
MSTTMEMPTLDLSDLFDDRFDAPAGPTVHSWLETMWGITPGKSSPTGHGVRYEVPAGLAGWYGMCGLAPFESSKER